MPNNEERVINKNEEFMERYVTQLKKKEKENKKKFKFKKKQMYNRKKPVLIVCALVTVLIALCFVFATKSSPFKDFGSLFEKKAKIDVVLNSTGEETLTYVAPQRPLKIFATTLIAGNDFSADNNIEQLGKIVDNIKAKGLTTIFVRVGGDTYFADTNGGKATLDTLVTLANAKGISVFFQVDLNLSTAFDPTNPATSLAITNRFTDLAKTNGLGGIVVSGIERNVLGADFNQYLTLGGFCGYKNYSEALLTNLVKDISYAVKKTNPQLFLNILCDSIYTSDKTSITGIKTTDEKELLKDKNADVILWLKEKYFDGVFVSVSKATTDKTPSFEDVVNWWSNNIPAESNLGFVLNSELAVKGEESFKNPDQLTRQLMSLNTLNLYTFCFNSYSAMESDLGESSAVAYKYLVGDTKSDYILSNLAITSPKQQTVQVYDNIISFVGASDPNFKLTLNGEAVERTEYGYFSFNKELKVGKNTFTFEHKGTAKTYTVNYRYVVIKNFSPEAAVTIDSGSTLIVKAIARKSGTIKATLNGQTITLNKTSEEKDTDFATFVGGFPLGVYSKDTSIGKITFTGVAGGVTESFKSRNVTVKKKYIPPVSFTSNSLSGNTVSPNDYISVGNTLIAEVIKYQIETFTGSTYDDLSQPFNNYLPLGTVDYCSENTSVDPDSGNIYRTLRCGKRVYAKESKGNIRTIRGTLPAYNTLKAESIKTNGQHTVLTLNSYWKAPFNLVISPQKYYGGSSDQRGSITDRTFKYVDITFCYATKFEGDLSALANSPIFSKAELIKGTSDYTLRLHLKKTGSFYGWTANYDSKGNLVFKFLNPIKAQAAANAYGGTLNGITVAIDAGHGGYDGGAVGTISKYDEADRNLLLAKMLQTKLSALGAKVVMTRTSDVAISQDNRILAIKNSGANLAISVHRNSSVSSSARGFGSYYFNPYTQEAASIIQKKMNQSGNYSRSFLSWHYFYLSRISDMPVVLTENGFMSNATDFQNMLSDKWNEKCADAIVKGVVEYFLNIG